MKVLDEIAPDVQHGRSDEQMPVGRTAAKLVDLATSTKRSPSWSHARPWVPKRGRSRTHPCALRTRARGQCRSRQRLHKSIAVVRDGGVQRHGQFLPEHRVVGVDELELDAGPNEQAD